MGIIFFIHYNECNAMSIRYAYKYLRNAPRSHWQRISLFLPHKTLKITMCHCYIRWNIIISTAYVYNRPFMYTLLYSKNIFICHNCNSERFCDWFYPCVSRSLESLHFLVIINDTDTRYDSALSSTISYWFDDCYSLSSLDYKKILAIQKNVNDRWVAFTTVMHVTLTLPVGRHKWMLRELCLAQRKCNCARSVELHARNLYLEHFVF